MQDIAGARIVLPEYGERNLEVQDVTFDLLQQETVFGASWTVVRTKDDRDPPDPTGYRPLHVIVSVDELLAEIQIRTRHQDRWAQVVEGLDSRGSWDLKHGSGPADLLAWLRRLSDALRQGDLGLAVEVPPLPGGERGEAGER
jgi:ppGpp synthetase/RelA/SpoT-type nucleotidyltranferase